MTTTVKIDAHCAKEKEVRVQITDGCGLVSDILEDFRMQDGESTSRIVFDNRTIVIAEVMKDE